MAPYRAVPKAVLSLLRTCATDLLILKRWRIVIREVGCRLGDPASADMLNVSETDAVRPAVMG